MKIVAKKAKAQGSANWKKMSYGSEHVNGIIPQPIEKILKEKMHISKFRLDKGRFSNFYDILKCQMLKTMLIEDNQYFKNEFLN